MHDRSNQGHSALYHLGGQAPDGSLIMAQELGGAGPEKSIMLGEEPIEAPLRVLLMEKSHQLTPKIIPLRTKIIRL